MTFSYILSGYLKIIINTECYFQYLSELSLQPDKKAKHGKNLQRASWYLHQIKKTYINTVCTKSASKDPLNCFTIFGSSACQGHCHVQLLNPLTKCPRTNLNLITTKINVKKVKKVKDTFKIKLW